MKIDESVEMIAMQVEDKVLQAYKVMLAFGAFDSPTATPQLLAIFLGKENQRWEIDQALTILEQHELVERVPPTEDTALFYRVGLEAHRHARSEIEDSEFHQAVDACLRFVEAYQERVRSHFALLRAELNNIAGVVNQALQLERYADVRRIADLLYSHTDHSNSEGFLHRQGHTDLAIVILGYALESAEREQLQREIVIYTSNIGSAYADLGQFAIALQHYDKALKMAETMDDGRLQAINHCRIGIVYRQEGRIELAAACLEKALNLAQHVGERHWEGVAYGNLGSVYREKRDFDRALECYEKSLFIAAENNDRRAEGVRRRRIGITYRHMKAYKTALDYLQYALQIARIEEDRREECITLSNIGITYRAMEEYKFAGSYLKEALKLARAMGDRRSEGVILGNLGANYLAMAQWGTALATLTEALAVRREVQDQVGAGYDLWNLGQVAAAMGDMEQAQEHYHGARAIFGALEMTAMVTRIEEALAESHKSV